MPVGLLALTLDLIPIRALRVWGIRRFRVLLPAGSNFVATTCFGLVHGFGFAGFLMETGILGTSLFIPLLGFNLGVEVGQLILVAIALAIAYMLRDKVPHADTGRQSLRRRRLLVRRSNTYLI